MPVQEIGIRPARALPYELHVHARIIPNTQAIGASKVELEFVNSGEATAVFHVYDRLNLTAVPRRYTVEPGKELVGIWAPAAAGTYDLWVLGPNGFHRHFTGNAKRVAAAAQPNPEVRADYNPATGELAIQLTNTGSMPCTFMLVANKYYAKNLTQVVPAKGEYRIELPLSDSAYWYDFSVRVKGQADYSRRLAGHLETGAPSFSDPALGGTAIADQYKV